MPEPQAENTLLHRWEGCTVSHGLFDIFKEQVRKTPTAAVYLGGWLISMAQEINPGGKLCSQVAALRLKTSQEIKPTEKLLF